MPSCACPNCLEPVTGFAMICDRHKAIRQLECAGYIAQYGRKVPRCTMPAHREHNCTPAWIGGRCKPCGPRCCFCGAEHQYPDEEAA
jgi:hypothetical protein